MDSNKASSHFGIRFARWEKTLLAGLVVCAVIAAIYTYIVLQRGSTGGISSGTAILALWIDLVILLAIAFLLVRRIASAWRGSESEGGSPLLIRILSVFTVVSALPTVIISIFAIIVFNFGIQSWFSTPVRNAVTQSRSLAQDYFAEYTRSFRFEAIELAETIDRNFSGLRAGDPQARAVLRREVRNRQIAELVLLVKQGDTADYKAVLREGLSATADIFSPEITQEQFELTDRGEVLVSFNRDTFRQNSLKKIHPQLPFYLYISRVVDLGVINRLEAAQQTIENYERLEESRAQFQINFFLIFLVVGILLLLVSMAMAFLFASQLTRPVRRLMAAAKQFGQGDLSTRVAVQLQGKNELGTLSQAFNDMADQLSRQQSELIDANRQLDLRRRFIEAVLEGVSAGVIGLDTSGKINLCNQSASDLLGVNLEDYLDSPLVEIVPELRDVFKNAQTRSFGHETGEINLHKSGMSSRTLIVSVLAERKDQAVVGYVVTFDDITELQSAQRSAAWSDVARRIAHEIKNPLTPIQLSAERLKRKYSKQITHDVEVFNTCTDTIIRQVGDIGKMVDEFSSFARSPEPSITMNNLNEICRQALFLQSNANSEIEFSHSFPKEKLEFQCDGRLISQAIINLLRNATDSVESRLQRDQHHEGRIHLSLSSQNDSPIIIVKDNGIGLPQGEKHRLTEPYVTTRKKGTGLGLAIVKKIMEDHGGNVIIEDLEPGGNFDGAKVTLRFGASMTKITQGASDVSLSQGE